MESALELFKLNTELFSQVANCWDSYGEGLLKHGDKSAALDAYQQALELDSHLPSALEAVKSLTKKR